MARKHPTIASLDARLSVVEKAIVNIKSEQEHNSKAVAELDHKMDLLLEKLDEHDALKRVRLSKKAKFAATCVGTAIGAAITALVGGCF